MSEAADINMRYRHMDKHIIIDDSELVRQCKQDDSVAMNEILP